MPLSTRSTRQRRPSGALVGLRILLPSVLMFGACSGQSPSVPTSVPSPVPTPLLPAALDQSFEPLRTDPVGISGPVGGAEICEARFSGGYRWAQSFTVGRAGVLREIELRVYPFLGVSANTRPDSTYEVAITPDPMRVGSPPTALTNVLAMGRFSANSVLLAGTDPRDPACTPNCHTWVRFPLDRGVPVQPGQNLAIVPYRPEGGCWAWVNDSRGGYVGGTSFEWLDTGQVGRGRGDLGFRTYN